MPVGVTQMFAANTFMGGLTRDELDAPFTLDDARVAGLSLERPISFSNTLAGCILNGLGVVGTYEVIATQALVDNPPADLVVWYTGPGGDVVVGWIKNPILFLGIAAGDVIRVPVNLNYLGGRGL